MYVMILAASIVMQGTSAPLVSFELDMDGKRFASLEECQEAIPETLPIVPDILDALSITGTSPGGTVWVLYGHPELTCKTFFGHEEQSEA